MIRRTLGSVLPVLMALTACAGAVTATGDSATRLSACSDAPDDYYGGIQVFARDRGHGASRVMCPPTELLICQPPACDPAVVEGRTGFQRDNNLNVQQDGSLPREDIWNGFSRNIESFSLRADAGCSTRGILLGRATNHVGDPNVLFFRHLDNYLGATPVTRRVEVHRGQDNKAWGVIVTIDCLPENVADGAGRR